MEVNERIIFLLRSQRKKSSDLAQFLGIEASSITRWSSGSSPSVKYIADIAQFFNVSVAYLLTGEDERISFLSTEAIEIATEWMLLDERNKTIVKGDIYRRVDDIRRESMQNKSVASRQKPKKPRSVEPTANDGVSNSAAATGV